MRELLKHKAAIFEAGIERGLRDDQIAKKLRLPKGRITAERELRGISSIAVTQNRYDSWIRLLKSEMPLDEVASLYGVEPKTIRLTLAMKRDFSFRAMKAEKVAKSKHDLATKQAATKNPYTW